MVNLKAEMARYGVRNEDIQQLLGCSEKTARNKVNNATELTYSEAEKIRDTFFPSVRLEYLFRTEDPQKTA